MNPLNSPIGLSPVEVNIIEQFSDKATSGIVVGAGDGRLTRAIKEKLGSSVNVYNVEPREYLHSYLEDCGEVSRHPWELSGYERFASKTEGVDFIVFYNIHEFWGGELSTLTKILKFLKPTGQGWLNFYNTAALYELERNLLPLETGYYRLGQGMDLWPRMDLSSWLMYFEDIGASTHAIWGLLQKEMYKYCQREEEVLMELKIKDYPVQISNMADAYLLGAPVVCLNFKMTKPGPKEQGRFTYLEVKPSMMQEILFPYEDLKPSQLDIFENEVSISRYKETQEGESKVPVEFFLSQLEDFGVIEKVLVVGCRWGEDLLSLKKLKPEWEITGIDPFREHVDLGKSVVETEGASILPFSAEGEFPFEDGSFDAVFSLKYFSTLYQPMAKHFSKEIMRVSRKGAVHFEDSRGAEISFYLKAYALPEIYSELGYDCELLPIDVGNEPTGMYILKVLK